ncbi:HYR domain-containing protein, partial [Aquiflexum sp.]|uniref:HYR domain-containing protein n=1 Tax=Aquiflexum sp. TaxID=1872584 RepID=UPI003593BCE4
MNIYHNSVINTSTGEAIQYNGLASSGFRIKNNIFKANTGQSVYVSNSSGLVEMDFNDLATSGTYVGRWGSGYAGDLSDWQSLSSMDANSLSFDPQFASDTDLTASSPALANAGTPLAEVAADINGVARKATPSMGANEYDSEGLSPLSGIYTIDPAGTGDRNFTTIQSTVDAMILNGVDGPVVFEIASGIYEEQVLINDIAGGSSTNTVTYVPASGNLGDVTVQFSSTVSADNYVIRLDNASDIIFRNLIIEATNASFARTIWTVNRLDNLLIEGCRIESPDTGSTNGELGNVRLDPSISTNVRFINNQIIGGRKGVFYRGGSATSFRAPGFEFRGNEITGPFQYGIYLERLTAAIIEDNSVTLHSASWSSSYTMDLRNVDGATRVVGNRLFGGRQYGLNMQFCNAVEGSPALVANNMIGSSSNGQTVFLYYSTHVNFYHNSVINTSTGEAIQYNGLASSGFRIKNNIFKANTGQAVYVPNSTGLVEMDFNDLFTSGTSLGRWSNTYAPDLPTWQSLSSRDANSLNEDPLYISDTDLTPQNPVLTEAGTDLTNFVSTDIDGNPRTIPVSIGAVEFAQAGDPLIGEYTIDPAGTGDRNFISFAAAAEALRISGIAGKVDFLVADGTYEEQLNFGTVPGASSSFSINFSSASTNPLSVIIVHSDSYTMRLDNAEHHSFSNMTFKTLGSGQVIQVRNRGVNLLFENNIIESPATTNTSNVRGGIDVTGSFTENIRILNNKISGGANGIYVKGASSASRAGQVIVSENEVNDVYFRSIYLNYTNAPQVIGNIIRTSSTAHQISLLLENIEGGLLVKNNRVTSVDGNALRVVNASGNSSTPNLVYNNFLQGEGNNRTVYLSNTNYLLFYHNSIWNQGNGASMEYANYGGNNELVNSIFQATNGYALRIATTGAFSNIDYNNLFTSGTNLGRWGSTDAVDLGAWRAASGYDANSLTINSQFVSSEDLTPQEEALAVNGTDLTAIVSDDINGVPRFDPVSIGAVEFFSESGRDLAVVEILTPNSACLLTDQEAVSVRISNVGTSFAGNIILSYQINEDTPVEEALPSSVVLSPGQTYNYIFENLADLSQKGEFTIKVSIVESDENMTNNVLSKIIFHYADPIVTISDDASICKGQGINLSVTGGQSYLWSTGESNSSIYVQPEETTTYSVLITDENGCSTEEAVTVTVGSIPEINYVGDEGYESSFVSPSVGTSATEFIFRINYVERSGLLPGSGYPRLTVRSFLETREIEMIEEDPMDQDVSDGKIYRAAVLNLVEDADWESEIKVIHTGGCETTTGFLSIPLVSSDLLDVAIFAGDILFSNDEPAIGEEFTITGIIRNTSDFPAENFVVSVYDDENLIASTIVDYVAPQSTKEVSWNYSFLVSGYHEIKVVLDETDVLDEKNELNNFAIRFYALPEGINVSASLNKSVIIPSETFTLSGVANYYGLDLAVTPKVSGATVRINISDGRSSTAYTNSNGGFSRSFSGPTELGIYTVSGEVDDGRFIVPFGPFTIEVVEEDNSEKLLLPDLETTLTLDAKENRNHYLRGESITGVAKVTNIGQAPAENFVFRYASCQGVIGEIFIPLLQPGEFIEYPFVTSILDDNLLNSCNSYDDHCVFSARADHLNQLAETSKSNNNRNISVKIFGELPDLIPEKFSSIFFNLEDTFNISIKARNIGGLPTSEPFVMNVYVDDVIVDSRTFSNSINVCSGISTYKLSWLFETTNDKEIRIVVDEPYGSGAIEEYNEVNNQLQFTIKYRPKKPDLNTLEYWLSIEPAHPDPGENFKIKALYRNIGASDIAEPFYNSFTIVENGVENILESQILDGVEKNQTKSDSVYTSISSYGNHSLIFSTDSRFEIDESSESNNVATVPLCVDLSPNIFNSGFPIGVWRGGFQIYTEQYLIAYIRNYGIFEAEDVSVKFYLDDVEIASTVISKLPRNTSGAYVRLPYIFTESGTFTLKVVVDEEGKFTECVENNNEVSRSIEILTPGPDLRVLTQYISPSKLNPDLDEQINLFVSYDNIGVVPSGPFKVRLLIDGQQIGEDVEVSGVAAGEDGTVAITEPYSSSIGGLKTIEAIVDVLEEQPDPNRTNNSALRTIFVGDAPNLAFTSLDFSNNCPGNGEEVTLSATIINEGDVGTDATLTFYYKSGETLELISEELISVDAKGTLIVSTPIVLLSNTFSIYAEITDAYPFEYNLLDNSIERGFCTDVLTQFALTTSVAGEGIILRDPNLNLYNEGSTVSLIAIPAEGFSFTQWSGDFSGTDNPLSFTMDSDKNLVAEFTENYRIKLKVTNESCFEAADGRVEVDVLAGVAPYTIEWYKNGELLPETGTIINNLSAGFYEVRVTDSGNITITDDVDLIVGDFQYPIVVIPAEISVFLDENGDGFLSITEINDDSFDNCGIKSKFFNDGLSTISFDCTNVGQSLTVDFKVEDTNGNVSVKPFNVVVQEEVKPVITNVPTNIEISTDAGTCGAVVTWTEPSAADNCGIESFTADYTSGAFFPVGETTVTYTATDIHGNFETASFTVTVNDTEKPTITNIPANIIVNNDAGTCGAVVTWIEPTADDNCGIESFTADFTSGAVFPVGETTVTYIATDIHNNVETDSFTVTVNDTEKPTMTNIPANIIVDNDAGTCGAVVTWTEPSAADNCGIESFTADYTSGAFFPVGETTVTYTATDIHGNEQTASFTVTVNDTEDPVITCPADISTTVEFGETGKIIIYDLPIASDNCGTPTLIRVSGLASGEVFLLGSTTVIYRATDAAGNTADCSFTVTITESDDNEDPVIIDCPSNITVSNDPDSCDAVVNWTEPTATDNSGTVTLTSNFEPGSVFPVGTTEVKYTATDGAGNQSTCTFNVTVTDEELPVITCPAGINTTVEFGETGKVITYALPTATDNCGTPAIELVSGPASGEFFPVGPTEVTYKATDDSGNVAGCSFTVTVTESDDNEGPIIIDCPSDISVSNDPSVCSAVVTWTEPTATDNSGTVNMTSNFEPGSVFPVGTTEVNYTATDEAGNQSTCSFNVTVTDEELPLITCPADISTTVEFGETGKIIIYDLPMASDNCGTPTLIRVSGLASGEVFP